PDIEMHRGDASQFSRPATYLDGHARLSPGDHSESKPAAKSEQPGNADPMEQPTPTPHPIRAEDFARGMGAAHGDGAARPSPSNDHVRVPVRPEVALFGAAADRFDYGQLTPVDVGNIPNNDDGAPQHMRPAVDVSPSRGADVAPDIVKTPEATAPWGKPGAWNKE
ncbi:MAG: hypothetical protein WCC30_07535, partial [Candidatus Dormiibacterota bacterium]